MKQINEWNYVYFENENYSMLTMLRRHKEGWPNVELMMRKSNFLKIHS